MKPASSLFAKILAWFFLNMVVVAAALAVFIAFQPHVSLYAIFDQQGTNRLRTAGLLIAHDLSQTPTAKWPDVLARHAAIHRVDFMVLLEDGSRFSSTDVNLPEPVMAQARDRLRPRPPKGLLPAPHGFSNPRRTSPNVPGGGSPKGPAIGMNPPGPPLSCGRQTAFYDADAASGPLLVRALRIPLPPGPIPIPAVAVLLAVSGLPDRQRFLFRSASLDGRGCDGDIDLSAILGFRWSETYPGRWPA